MKVNYAQLVRGCGQPMVDAAARTAERKIKNDMHGFNRRTKAPRPFASVPEFQRYQLRQKADQAIMKLAPHLSGCTVYRLTLTVSNKVRPCRVDHARALRRAAIVMFSELRALCVGYVAALHVDTGDRLHWDVTVLVRNPDITAFEHKVRHDVHATGWRMAGRQRAYTCHRRRQGATYRDLERSIDYTLKHDRYKRHPGRTTASIRALGIARASGFGQVTKSKLGPNAKRMAKPLAQKANRVQIPTAVNGVTNPMTVQGTPPRVSSTASGPTGSRPTTKRNKPGPQPKSAGKAYRRNRMTRVTRAATSRFPAPVASNAPPARPKPIRGVLDHLGSQLRAGAALPLRIHSDAFCPAPAKTSALSVRKVRHRIPLEAQFWPWLAYRQNCARTGFTAYNSWFEKSLSLPASAPWAVHRIHHGFVCWKEPLGSLSRSGTNARAGLRSASPDGRMWSGRGRRAVFLWDRQAEQPYLRNLLADLRGEAPDPNGIMRHLTLKTTMTPAPASQTALTITRN